MEAFPLAERPGVMFYYEQWEPILKLPDKEVARLVRATLQYGKHGEEPLLSGVSAILWEMVKPTLDRDDDRYKIRCIKNRHAVYVREEKKAGRDPLGFDEWCKKQSIAINGYHLISNGIQSESESETESQSQQESELLFGADKPHKSRFIPPTVEEVAEYCRERGNGVDAQTFVDHYEANGWMRGKNKMKDWKACVRVWEDKSQAGKTCDYIKGDDSL